MINVYYCDMKHTESYIINYYEHNMQQKQAAIIIARNKKFKRFLKEIYQM